MQQYFADFGDMGLHVVGAWAPANDPSGAGRLVLAGRRSDEAAAALRDMMIYPVGLGAASVFQSGHIDTEAGIACLSSIFIRRQPFPPGREERCPGSAALLAWFKQFIPPAGSCDEFLVRFIAAVCDERDRTVFARAADWPAGRA